MRKGEREKQKSKEKRKLGERWKVARMSSGKRTG